MGLSRTHIWLITITVLVGGGLVFLGLFGEAGLMWTVTGLFFLSVSATALVAKMSNTIDGPIGALLRRRELRVVMFALILVLFILTILASTLDNSFRDL